MSDPRKGTSTADQMSTGALEPGISAWTCACGAVNNDIRTKCRSCGAARRGTPCPVPGCRFWREQNIRMKTIRPTIHVLKSEMDLAAAAYDKAKDAYHTALKAAYHLKVGDIIVSTKGALAKVDTVYVQYGEVCHSAAMQKKDGTFGERLVPIWRDEWKAAVLQEKAA